MTGGIPDEGALESAARTRAAWDDWSDRYQERHGHLLRDGQAEAWGLWRLQEAELHALGVVTGKRILELGCGAAHWSASLARRAAYVVGVDASFRQLGHARGAVAGTGAALVHAGGELLPFASESFDIVFSDYGAMSWCDPRLTVPEVSRVLVPGGRLAFCTTSALFNLCLDPESQELTTTLQRDYFGLRTRSVGDVVDYQVPVGEWIGIFTETGLVVERLVEVRPPEEAATTFRDRPLDWARRWPAENIWMVVKRGS